MGRNCDWKRSANTFRRRLYRSRDGKLLGVFSGISESLGFGVCRTRWIGCVILLLLASSFGAHGVTVSLLVCGFFYLLVAVLMQAPRDRGGPYAQYDVPPGEGRRAFRPAAVPYAQAYRPRVDLGLLDQRLDSLNVRIQRMETIVTDRQYDWDRRMEG